MKTSSVVAAVLTFVCMNSATAGGWIAHGRTNAFPPPRIVARSFERSAARFDRFDRPGQSVQFDRLDRFGPVDRFQRFGQFERVGRNDFRFRRDRSLFGFGYLGYGGPGGPYPSDVGEPASAPAVILAPSYVTVVASGDRCSYGDPERAAFTGGPKIIVIGAPARPASQEKLPTVIYGAQGACAW